MPSQIGDWSAGKRRLGLNGTTFLLRFGGRSRYFGFECFFFLTVFSFLFLCCLNTNLDMSCQLPRQKQRQNSSERVYAQMQDAEKNGKSNCPLASRCFPSKDRSKTGWSQVEPPVEVINFIKSHRAGCVVLTSCRQITKVKNALSQGRKLREREG